MWWFDPQPPRQTPSPPTVPHRPRLTPQQWAQREASKFIAAQVKAIQEQQDLYLEELRRQAELRMRQGQALAAWLQAQNFPGRIQGLYQTAGSDIAGYAKGFGGEIAQIAAQDAAEQQNMLSGTGQEGAVRNEGAGMSDVLYGAYGWSPAKKFAETGAAYASDAALQPAFATQFAAQEAWNLHQEGLGNLVEFAKAIAEARAGKPALVQELLDRRLKLQYEREDRALARKKWEMDWFLKMAAYYNMIGDNKRADFYMKRAMMADRGLTVDGAPRPGYHIDPNSGMVVKDGWHHVRRGGRWVPERDSSSTKRDDLWGDIQRDMASESFTITEVTPPTVIAGVTVPGERVTRKMTYKEAFAYLWNKYSGLVKNKGRLRRLIDKVLRNAGITPSGEITDAHDRQGK
ncbi:MAG: hypothetical protein KatS3mg015_2816 [Fimbriimonadales bacterium]|nr:MAG: hypothetical protein KatS3mg015_2816 [Fimbriimonadales bacterium]